MRSKGFRVGSNAWVKACSEIILSQDPLDYPVFKIVMCNQESENRPSHYQASRTDAAQLLDSLFGSLTMWIYVLYEC